MNIINLGQVVYNFLRIDIKNKNQQIVQDPHLDPFSYESMMEQQDNLQNSVAQNASRNQELNTEKAQLAKLKTPEKALLLKELMNLPKDVKEFLLIMSSEEQPSGLSNQELAKLLINNNLDLSKLAMFIQQNGKEALSKLFQMIANFNAIGASIESSQLNDLSKVINACVSASGEKPSQALKNVLLLYLPWLPVHDSSAFKLEIAESSGAAAGSEEDSITILISTVNFGNVQAVIIKEDKSSINIFLTCSEEFPSKKIEELIKEESKNYNVQSNISIDTKESLTTNPENAQTQVCMNVSPGVNPFLILMAGSVIKAVISLDNSDSLRQTRKEML